MNLLHAGKYFRDPRVSGWKKALGVLAVVYVLMPFDAVPDVVPVFGWLDDIGILGAVVAYLVRDMSKLAAKPPEPPAEPRKVSSQIVG